MKILIVDTYYKSFLKYAYECEANLKTSDYTTQLNHLLGSSFGTSDAYSTNLIKHGWDTTDLIVNCPELQVAWAKEHLKHYSKTAVALPPKVYRIPLLGKHFSRMPGLTKIALDQIFDHKPDVVFCQDVNFFSAEILKKIKQSIPLVIGQIASPLPPKSFLEHYDLILTSFPHFVEKLRRMGINSEYFQIGFDERMLNRISMPKKDIEFSFIGGLSRHHKKATSMIEYLASRSNLAIYGYGAEKFRPNSIIRKHHKGKVWGLEMYKTLSRSRITLNRHINVSENNANNMRLYEATGMGTLLLTDRKDNLHKIFEIDKEVVTYSSKEEALDKVNYYLNNPKEADKIAAAGQRRTLKEHSYEKRMGELNGIILKHLGQKII